MKKLVLDVNALAVESFEADGAPAALRGTVRGASWTEFSDCKSADSACLPTDVTWTCP